MSQNPTAAVEVKGLRMQYGDKVAVDGLDLTVDRHTITAVLGPNGAGKTTTLETCEGYRKPQAGTVRVLGLDPVAQRRELLPRIGVMLQAGGAWSGVRAIEMLQHVASLHAHPLPVDMLAERLGLGDCGRTPYRRLSGGQQQRLSLAAAVIGRPELAFLDEPTAGLDPQARHATWDLVGELRAAGVSVVLTTHYMEEAERLADRVVIIDDGRVVADAPPGELTAGRRRLRFRAPAGLRGLEAGLPAGHTVTESPSGAYEVDGPAPDGVGPEAVATVTGWCARHDVTPDDLRLERRTLEDVFLELTGRELRS